MKKPEYVIYIHRMYDKGKPKLGGMDYIIDYLLKSEKRVLIVDCPLYPWQGAKITATLKYKDEALSAKCVTFPTNNRWVVWFLEAILNVVISIMFHARGSAVFSTDPLTSFPAIVLRKLGYFRYHYYHCTDYSEVRFNNILANKIYRSLLAFSVFNADLVGCVSRRIHEKIKNYNYKKLMYVPNSPGYKDYEQFRVPAEKRTRGELVLTCSSIEKRFMVLETIKVFHEVRIRNQDVKLKIIGGKDIDPGYFKEAENLVRELGEEVNVVFSGFLPREISIKEVAKAYIGFAFYDGKVSFSKYADPLKIREYAALGIPCVSDKVTSAAEEMADAGAGYVVSEYSEAADLICRLMIDDVEYKRLADNALTWAQKTDKEKILNVLLRDNVGL